MKKKLLALLLAGSMVIGSSGSLYGEELISGDTEIEVQTGEVLQENAAPLIEDESAGETGTVSEIPEAGEVENPEEGYENSQDNLPEDGLLIEVPEVGTDESTEADLLGDGMLSDGAEDAGEEALSSEAEALDTTEVTYPDMEKSVEKAGAIRYSDKENPDEGCVFVGVSGTFSRNGVTDAVKKINQIRKEACDKGYPNPNNPSKKLTSKDYHPISWSSGLEWIAQTRAAEASYTMGHVRPNDEVCFDCEYPGVAATAENLAWNHSGIMYAVNQWYEEKNDWVNQNNQAVTGHYTSMIDPEITHFGLGCYKPDKDVVGYGWLTVSGEFGYVYSDSNVPASSGKVTQIIQAKKNQISPKLTVPALVEQGKTGQMSVIGTVSIQNYYGSSGDAIPCTFPLGVTWKCSNRSIATVDQNGKVTGVGEGRAAVYAYIEDVKTVTKINVSKRPELIGAYNSVKGLGVKFKASEVADRYVIYRKYKSDWTKIDTVMANSPSLTISGDTIMYYDTSAKNNYGGGYIYSVAAQRGKNCATTYDTRGVAIYRLLEPTISKASAVGNGKVKLTWSKVLAMGYEVQYQENGTTGWKKCPQTTGTSQTIGGLKKGKTYQFHIRCYKTNSSRGTFYSAYSKSVSVKVK